MRIIKKTNNGLYEAVTKMYKSIQTGKDTNKQLKTGNYGLTVQIKDNIEIVNLYSKEELILILSRTNVSKEDFEKHALNNTLEQAHATNEKILYMQGKTIYEAQAIKTILVLWNYPLFKKELGFDKDTGVKIVPIK